MHCMPTGLYNKSDRGYVCPPQVPREKRTISQPKADILGSDVDPNKRWRILQSGGYVLLFLLSDVCVHIQQEPYGSTPWDLHGSWEQDSGAEGGRPSREPRPPREPTCSSGQEGTLSFTRHHCHSVHLCCAQLPSKDGRPIPRFRCYCPKPPLFRARKPCSGLWPASHSQPVQPQHSASYTWFYISWNLQGRLSRGGS